MSGGSTVSTRQGVGAPKIVNEQTRPVRIIPLTRPSGGASGQEADANVGAAQVRPALEEPPKAGTAPQQASAPPLVEPDSGAQRGSTAEVGLARTEETASPPRDDLQSTRLTRQEGRANDRSHSRRSSRKAHSRSRYARFDEAPPPRYYGRGLGYGDTAAHRDGPFAMFDTADEPRLTASRRSRGDERADRRRRGRAVEREPSPFLFFGFN